LDEDSRYLARAAELLRSGATMLAQACPACATPLFKLGEQVFCAKCNKPVIVVKAAEDEAKVLREQTLANTEQILLDKIRDMQSAIEKEEDPARLAQLTESLSNLLTALEKLRGTRSASR
jgi:UPF0148 protein